MPSQDDIRRCLAIAEEIGELEPDDPRYVEFERAVARITKTAKKKRRLARRQARSAHDDAIVRNTERVASFHGKRPDAAPTTVKSETSAELIGERSCYVCKAGFRQVDSHYQSLCPPCAAAHHGHRSARADLSGRRALVTGGRIKIGFETALRLLRDGAAVTITTRFPSDADRRYREQPDRAEWIDRLRIVGLDFRDVRGLIEWIADETSGPPLDILVNNAAQTIRRAPAYYAALAAVELAALAAAPAIVVPDSCREGLASFHRACAESQDDERLAFPVGRVDAEGLQLDLSTHNSWTKTLANVSPAELVETHLVTAIAPFLLCSGLKPAMLRSAKPDRYIVNVSAMEGVFNYTHKTDRHPHTNMAKAAVNMLTRTSAKDFANDGIYMVSVDTGWITDENPEPTRQRTGFCPPLDVHDGAARVYAPIVSGVSGSPLCGVFLKNFRESPW